MRNCRERLCGPSKVLLIIAPVSASIQFNIVSKHLGAERMSFYIDEAASDLRDLMSRNLGPPKAKL